MTGISALMPILLILFAIVIAVTLPILWGFYKSETLSGVRVKVTNLSYKFTSITPRELFKLYNAKIIGQDTSLITQHKLDYAGVIILHNTRTNKYLSLQSQNVIKTAVDIFTGQIYPHINNGQHENNNWEIYMPGIEVSIYKTLDKLENELHEKYYNAWRIEVEHLRNDTKT